MKAITTTTLLAAVTLYAGSASAQPVTPAINAVRINTSLAPCTSVADSYNRCLDTQATYSGLFNCYCTTTVAKDMNACVTSASGNDAETANAIGVLASACVDYVNDNLEDGITCLKSQDVNNVACLQANQYASGSGSSSSSSSGGDGADHSKASLSLAPASSSSSAPTTTSTSFVADIASTTAASVSATGAASVNGQVASLTSGATLCARSGGAALFSLSAAVVSFSLFAL